MLLHVSGKGAASWRLWALGATYTLLLECFACGARKCCIFQIRVIVYQCVNTALPPEFLLRVL